MVSCGARFTRPQEESPASASASVLETRLQAVMTAVAETWGSSLPLVQARSRAGSCI